MNFEEKIKDTIEREKQYAEDLDSLKSNLGSNVGILIQNMLDQGKKCDR